MVTAKLKIKRSIYAPRTPLFIFTFIPIAFVALFKKVEWTPIVHDGSTTLDDMHEEQK